ncbi:MAG TPA: transposase [Opitutaceae bacterium]
MPVRVIPIPFVAFATAIRSTSARWSSSPTTSRCLLSKLPSPYKARWQIEIFFRWIKQHLRIRSFMGTSDNAVRIQIWSAISTYLSVAILKQTLKLKPSLQEILQVFSVTPFKKVTIAERLVSRILSFDTMRHTDKISNLF